MRADRSPSGATFPTCYAAISTCRRLTFTARHSRPHSPRTFASPRRLKRRNPSTCLIRERTLAGLKAARARGRKGGRKFALSKAQVRLAQAAMAHRDTSVAELCSELGIRPVTLYRYVGPEGQLREQGEKVLAT